jgi:hypothetical protein
MIVLKILLFLVTRTMLFFLREFNAFKLFKSLVIFNLCTWRELLPVQDLLLFFNEPARSLQILAKVTLLCHLNYYDWRRFFYHFGYGGKLQ